MQTPLIVGLVVEGRNDYRVLRPLIEKIIGTGASGRAVQFREIQPEPDATSGHYSEGGWNNVFKWCLRFPPSRRSALFFSSLLANAQPCDFLVVQLDGDVLDEYSSFSSAPLPPKPWDGARRVAYAEATLKEWLWGNRRSNNLSHFEKHIVLAIVWATETWIVSALDPKLANPEDEDPVPLLIKLRPSLAEKRRPGKLRKTGVGRHYNKLAKLLVGDIDRVSLACGQLNKLKGTLTALVK